MALTALAQGLARHAVENPTSADLPSEVLQENDFRAYRYGLDARIVDVDGAVKPLHQIAAVALQDAVDALGADGLDGPLGGIAAMLAEPPEWCHQRLVHGHRGMAGLVADLISRTMSCGD